MRIRSRVACLALVSAASLIARLAHAHNEGVHQEMTALAYQVIAAGAAMPDGTSSPEAAELFKAMKHAQDGLRALRSELVANTNKCLFNQDFGGGVVPSWDLHGHKALADVTLGELSFPVAPWLMSPSFPTDTGLQSSTGLSADARRQASSDCGLALNEQVARVLKVGRPQGPPGGPSDFAGMALGFWAQWPDNLIDDWRLRSLTTEGLKSQFVSTFIGTTTAISVTTGCLLLCGLFPPFCVACPAIGFDEGVSSIEDVESLNSESWTDSMYVGFGHFNDIKVASGSFATPPGKLGDRSGPHGSPDVTEQFVTAYADFLGLHVNHALSDGPKNYEGVLGRSGEIGSDGHRNATVRTAAEWEQLSFAHTELTALDNLALFGWQTFETSRKDGAKSAKGLGWVLHALGDATVPQHVVGSSGDGHRPFEDATDSLWPDVVLGGDPTGRDFIQAVIGRAIEWRRFIAAWRGRPERTTADQKNVPVRDLVDALTQRTLKAALAQEKMVFQSLLSADYLVKSANATAAYRDLQGFKLLDSQLLVDGIAAEVAFLVSAMEAP